MSAIESARDSWDPMAWVPGIVQFIAKIPWVSDIVAKIAEITWMSEKVPDIARSSKS